MKNNKGYTLVELLVTLAVFAIIMAEVGNMMINSSKLYLNGTYEVELQTEAQQLVQQMEELLIDVNHSVSVEYQDALGSDFITVSNNSKSDGSGDYTIYNFTVDKDPNLGYGTLYFNKTSSDGSSDVTNVPMAEYVQSISLDMAGYTSDVVTLNVSMNNGKYSYQTSQDIYLRNGVGSGGGYNYANGGSFNAELNVLRFKDYDLAALFNTVDGKKYTYEWDPTSVVRASTLYDLQNPNNPDGAVLKASSGLNGDDGGYGPFTLIGTSTANPNDKIRIKVSTDPMGDGPVVVFQNTASTYPTMSPAVVKGINIASDKISDITITLVYKADDSTIRRDPLNFDGTNPDQQVVYEPSGADAGGRVMFTIKGLSFARNGTDNTVEVTSSQFFPEMINLGSWGVTQANAYNFYIYKTDAPIYLDLVVKYGSVQELHMQLYLLPTPGVVEPMSMSPWDGVSEMFWGKMNM